jgi:hypothetical protein
MVLDKYITAYRRLPSPRNRARLAWNLCKYALVIPKLTDEQKAFLAAHEFI